MNKILLLLLLLLLAEERARAAVHYVDVNCAHPAPPYTSWLTAATNIQDAVDVAEAGDKIVVTDGIYACGGRAVTGALTNRVAVDKAITVCSVNGPDVTLIAGWQIPGVLHGEEAIRCVYLAAGAVLSGFTLTNGATRSAGDPWTEQTGGGVRSESASALVSNCVLAGNAAFYGGGGAWDGTLSDCVLTGNSSASGGGAYRGVLKDCLLVGNSASSAGGGARGVTLNDCTLRGNSAYIGGGVDAATLNDCTLTANYGSRYSGGAHGSQLWRCRLEGNTSGGDGGGGAWSTFCNCLLTGNSAIWGGAAYSGTLSHCTLTRNRAGSGGGGAWGNSGNPCRLNNCILYDNTVRSHVDNWFGAGLLNRCCTMPLPAEGLDNITNAPLFLDPSAGDWRLASNSPCINAGFNASACGGADLEGNPRIAGGTVDIGAFEFQTPASRISYAWLLQYGLPLDGSADTADPDADGHDNWREWRCGTVPADAASVLRLLPPQPAETGLLLRWTSVPHRVYCLERTSLPGAPASFVPVARHVVGLTGVTEYADPDAAGGGAFFYRVTVPD